MRSLVYRDWRHWVKIFASLLTVFLLTKKWRTMLELRLKEKKPLAMRLLFSGFWFKFIHATQWRAACAFVSLT